MLRDAVTPLAIGALEGLDVEPRLLAEAARDEAAHAVRLPFGRVHDLLETRAIRPANEFQHDGLLAALARPFGPVGGVRSGRLFGRPGLLRRNAGGLWRGGRRQGLDSLPDPAGRRLAVRELLDRLQSVEGHHSREAVPNLGEAVDGPLGGELGELLLGGEMGVAFGFRFSCR